MQKFSNRRFATKFRTAGVRVAAGLLTALLVAPAQGQTTNWLSDANGEWSVAGNWDNGVPNGDEVTAGSLILTAVPEPSSLFLLASLVGVFLLGRRRTQPARRAA